jgi:hypothetical protein
MEGEMKVETMTTRLGSITIVTDEFGTFRTHSIAPDVLAAYGGNVDAVIADMEREVKR